MMTRTVAILAAVVCCAGAPSLAPAQVVRPPNIQAPINAAKQAAAKTNEQTKAAERVGAEQQQGKQPTAPPSKAPSNAPAPAQSKAPAPAQSKAPAPQRGSGSVAEAGRRATVTVLREAFTYTADGRRDPFVSLMLSGELRPIITDLVLTGVIFDEEPAGRRSIALLTDNSTGEKYGVRVGQALGRMKVARITRESVTLDIDEFGLRRSETLVIDKTAAPAARRP
ncbi:MAG: hypothetical protein IT356_01655 [Gemmatimonadaceae bacterium]|nr:hypothetical protein [Gemmatimonadaceae bacterium]